MILQAQPNPAHEVLARWTRQIGGPSAVSREPSARQLTLITQNVDGLHERAGAEHLLRLHGSIWHVRCWQRCAAGREDWLDTTVPHPALPPPCPHCGGMVRPGVVWFGESLNPAVLSQATDAAAGADVFLTIGTSSVVYPAAGLVHHAKHRGAFTVEINTEATAVSSDVDVSLIGPAAEILVQLDHALGERRATSLNR
jgi:NAD-dependent deacetylase